jgi:hypothetical protein
MCADTIVISGDKCVAANSDLSKVNYLSMVKQLFTYISIPNITCFQHAKLQISKNQCM